MSGKTIAVIGAMEQEIETLKANLQGIRHMKFGRFDAYEGEMAGKRVVLVLSGIGKVNAAVATAWVVHQFAPDAVVNTGSAGGLGAGLKVGDVVVGVQVAHHDVDATAFGYERGQVPQLPRFFQSDEVLVAVAERAAGVFSGAKVELGLVVSGDQFVHDSNHVASIRTHFEGVSAVEMEAAAIAQTCHQLAVPFVVIRAVSDSADEKADISFEAFLKVAAESSAKMVMEIVAEIE